LIALRERLVAEPTPSHSPSDSNAIVLRAKSDKSSRAIDLTLDDWIQSLSADNSQQADQPHQSMPSSQPSLARQSVLVKIERLYSWDIANREQVAYYWRPEMLAITAGGLLTALMALYLFSPLVELLHMVVADWEKIQ
jgi:hypothetical protein